MPPVEAAITVSTSSTPAHGSLKTEAYSTGFAPKAAANSGVPLLRTRAIQSSPGLRAEEAGGGGVASVSGDASRMSRTLRRTGTRAIFPKLREVSRALLYKRNSFGLFESN